MSQSLDQAPARKLHETGGPATLDIAAIPDGFLLKRVGTTVVGVDPAGFGGADANAWHKTGDAFGAEKKLGTTDNFDLVLVRNNVEQVRFEAGRALFGASSFPTMETDDDPTFLFSGASPHFLDLIVQNTSELGGACTEVSAFNADGFGISLTAFGNNWDGLSALNFFPGDMGLGMRSGGGGGFPANARLFLASGARPIAFMTNYVEQGRMTPAGEFLWGVTAPEDTGNVIWQVAKDHNSYTRLQVQNKTNDTGASAGIIVNAATRYGELIAMPPAAVDATGRGADALVLESDNFANGIVILTQGSAPIKLKTNGDHTWYQIDGDGKMAWNGAATVAQPTVTGSRGGNAALASLLTALASLGLLIDSSS